MEIEKAEKVVQEAIRNEKVSLTFLTQIKSLCDLDAVFCSKLAEKQGITIEVMRAQMYRLVVRRADARAIELAS